MFSYDYCEVSELYYSDITQKTVSYIEENLIEELQLEEVSEKIATTNMISQEHLPKQPSNLDFNE